MRTSRRTTSEMSSAKRGPRTLYPRAQLLPEPLCSREAGRSADRRADKAEEVGIEGETAARKVVGIEGGSHLESKGGRFAVLPEAARPGCCFESGVDNLKVQVCGLSDGRKRLSASRFRFCQLPHLRLHVDERSACNRPLVFRGTICLSKEGLSSETRNCVEVRRQKQPEVQRV